MGVFVKNRPVGGAKVLRPLVFDVDERPLPPTEPVMLQAGEQEEVVVSVDHPIRVQVTPWGSWSSATVTV